MKRRREKTEILRIAAAGLGNATVLPGALTVDQMHRYLTRDDVMSDWVWIEQPGGTLQVRVSAIIAIWKEKV